MSREDIFSSGKGFFAPIIWADADAAKAVADKCIDLVNSTERVIFSNLHFYIPWINDIINSPSLVDFSKNALGDDIGIENTFLVYKKPGEEFEVPLHQDGIDDTLDLDPENSFSFWVSITKSDKENGGLIIYPFSHVNGYIDHSIDDNHTVKGAGTPGSIQSTIEYPEELIVLKAGEVVVMNSALMHKSGLNRTDLPRIGLNIRVTNKKGVRKRIGNTEPIYALGGDWGNMAYSSVLDFSNPIEDFRNRIHRYNHGG